MGACVHANPSLENHRKNNKSGLSVDFSGEWVHVFHGNTSLENHQTTQQTGGSFGQRVHVLHRQGRPARRLRVRPAKDGRGSRGRPHGAGLCSSGDDWHGRSCPDREDAAPGNTPNHGSYITLVSEPSLFSVFCLRFFDLFRVVRRYFVC